MPPTISISGAVSVGGTLTATVTGTPTPTLTLYRAGVSAGIITSPYTYVGADIGPSLTVVAANAAGTATSNALSYSPTADTNILEYWDAATLTPGTVTNWVGGKGVDTLINDTGTTTASATSFNTSHPGVTASGTSNLKANGSGLSTAIDAQSSLAWIGTVARTSGTTLAWIASYTSTDWDIIVHDSGNLEALGAGTYWKFTNDAGSDLLSPILVSVGFNRATSGAVDYIRLAGADTTLSTHGTPATPGGTYSSATFYLFSESTHAARFPGTIGWFAITTTAVTGNARATIEAYAKYTGGL